MTNEEAKGYMILAMHDTGLTYAQITLVLDALEWRFDGLTEPEAKERGLECLHKLRYEAHR